METYDQTPYFFVITTAHTIRFNRPLVDALVPRDVFIYFHVDELPDNKTIVLTRTDRPTPVMLNGSTQYISTRKLARQFIARGFEVTTRYAVELSDDATTITMRPQNVTKGPGFETHNKGKGKIQLTQADERTEAERRESGEKITRIFQLMYTKRQSEINQSA